MQLGTPAWLAAAAQAVNASESYRRDGAGWRWPLGLAFVPDDDSTREPSRYALLDLHDGHCHGARPTDRRSFEQAPFRLAASYGSWRRVLQEGADPMRCILLKELDLQGDRLTALRYLPSAKALLDAISTVEVEPVAS